MRILLILFQLLCFSLVRAENIDPETIYNNAQCLACHKTLNPELISAWQKSSHSDKTEVNKRIADCVQCHGVAHKNALVKSRADSACINCHGGNKVPVVHSYKTSKHGVILQMRKKKVDWNKALKSANYRVPGCAYCHMYNTQHNTRKSIRPISLFAEKLTGSDADQLLRQTLSVCSDCHAPRYTRRLFENGERMLDIARKKITEAQLLLDNVMNAETTFSDTELAPIKKQFHKMQTHFTNVYLGIAHQSPDYQWWHGQPALDGDLIRIKALISDLQRNKNLN